MGLSSGNIDVMKYFFSTLAPLYDIRAELGRIKAPTLAIVGKYDWVSPPGPAAPLSAGYPAPSSSNSPIPGTAASPKSRSSFRRRWCHS